MNDKVITYLTYLVVAAIGVLFVINAKHFLTTGGYARYINRSQVKGIDVEKDGQPYTLNIDQYSDAMQSLNMSIPFGERAFKDSGEKVPFDSVIIHRFDKPELVITPIGIMNGQLVYQQLEWTPQGYMRETGPGMLVKIFSSALEEEKK